MAPSLGVNLRVTGHCNQVIITEQNLQVYKWSENHQLKSFCTSSSWQMMTKWKSPVIVINRLMWSSLTWTQSDNIKQFLHIFCTFNVLLKRFSYVQFEGFSSRLYRKFNVKLELVILLLIFVITLFFQGGRKYMEDVFSVA